MAYKASDNNAKARSQSGYSFAELLVTMAIMVLVSIILATGVPVAKRAYEGVVDASNAHLLLSTATVRLRDVLSVADPTMKIDDSSSLEPGGDTATRTLASFYSLETGLQVTIIYDPKEGIRVKEGAPSYFDDLTAGDGSGGEGSGGEGSGSEGTEERKGKLLVPATAGIGANANLKVLCESIEYDESQGTFTVSNLRVEKVTAENDASEGSGNEMEGAASSSPIVAEAAFPTLTIRVLAAPLS